MKKRGAITAFVLLPIRVLACRLGCDLQVSPTRSATRIVAVPRQQLRTISATLPNNRVVTTQVPPSVLTKKEVREESQLPL